MFFVSLGDKCSAAVFLPRPPFKNKLYFLTVFGKMPTKTNKQISCKKTVTVQGFRACFEGCHGWLMMHKHGRTHAKKMPLANAGARAGAADTTAPSGAARRSAYKVTTATPTGKGGRSWRGGVVLSSCWPPSRARSMEATAAPAAPARHTPPQNAHAHESTRGGDVDVLRSAGLEQACDDTPSTFHRGGRCHRNLARASTLHSCCWGAQQFKANTG
jgi:hypothetical protein